MYWTKFNYETNEYDTILYTEELEVPHGDGFEVDMNGIEYSDYLADSAIYNIINGKLEKVEEIPSSLI